MTTVYSQVLMLELLATLDQKIFSFINIRLSHWLLDATMPVITDLFQFFWMKWAVLPLVFVTIIWFRRWNGVHYLLLTGVCVSLADIISHYFIKDFFRRSRPPFSGIEVILRTHEHYGYSFPSNHAANMFCFAMISSHFFPRAKYLFFAWAFLVAFSRVYVGVHYPLDVVGGACLGTAVGQCGLLIYLKIRKDKFLWLRS